MKSNRQRKLREYNDQIMPDMEEILYQAECSVALYRYTAVPPPPERIIYHSEAAARQRLQDIDQRLEELSLQIDAMENPYQVPEDASALVRCLTSWLDPRALSQEQLTNHGR
jgi:septation ring formation regulator EzrA